MELKFYIKIQSINILLIVLYLNFTTINAEETKESTETKAELNSPKQSNRRYLESAGTTNPSNLYDGNTPYSSSGAFINENFPSSTGRLKPNVRLNAYDNDMPRNQNSGYNHLYGNLNNKRYGNMYGYGDSTIGMYANNPMNSYNYNFPESNMYPSSGLGEMGLNGRIFGSGYAAPSSYNWQDKMGLYNIGNPLTSQVPQPLDCGEQVNLDTFKSNKSPLFQDLIGNPSNYLQSTPPPFIDNPLTSSPTNTFFPPPTISTQFLKPKPYETGYPLLAQNNPVQQYSYPPTDLFSQYSRGLPLRMMTMKYTVRSDEELALLKRLLATDPTMVPAKWEQIQLSLKPNYLNPYGYSNGLYNNGDSTYNNGMYYYLRRRRSI